LPLRQKRIQTTSKPLKTIKDTSSALTLELETVSKRKYVAHRHGEAIDQAFQLAKSLYANLNDWQKIHEKSNVQIYAMETPDLPISYIRGDGSVIGPWTAQEIISVIRSPFARKICTSLL
jgi:hypothetical protein